MHKPENINPDQWQVLLSLSQKLDRPLRQAEIIRTPDGQIDWKKSIKQPYINAYFLDEQGEVVGLQIRRYLINRSIFHSKLPSDFAYLKNLQYLAVIDFEISNIEVLRELKKLAYLDLSLNRLSDLNRVVSILKELPELKSLSLASNNITDITPLQELEGLTELDLSGNLLTRVELASLDSLDSLDLSENKITEVKLINLKSLRNLNINRNKIQSLILANTENIEDLNLSDNWIYDKTLKDILPEIKKQKYLQKLDLSKNELTKIELADFEFLVNLDLNENQIIEVKFSNLKILKYLNISKNKIRNLFFENVDNIEILNLWGNKINNKTFNNFFRKIEKKIKWLDLSVNKITNYGILFNLKKDNSILIKSSNSLKGITHFIKKSGFFTASYVRPIILSLVSSNLEVIIDTNFQIDNWLKVQHLEITGELEYKNIAGNKPDLEELIITDLKLKDKQDWQNLQKHIEQLNKLKYLELSWTGIEDLNLENFENLETLKITHSTLKKITLNNLPRLKTIILHDNLIEKIKIKDCNSLEIVNLHNNSLVEFDKTPIPKNCKVIISRNPVAKKYEKSENENIITELKI